MSFGRMPKGPDALRLKKTLNSENGELCNVYTKDLTLELRIYQKFAAFFNVSDYRLKLSSSGIEEGGSGDA